MKRKGSAVKSLALAAGIGLCVLTAATSAHATTALGSGILSGYANIADCVVNNLGPNVTLAPGAVQIVDALSGDTLPPTVNGCVGTLHKGELCIVNVNFGARDYRTLMCRATLPVTSALAAKNFRGRIELLDNTAAVVNHSPLR